MLAEKQLHLYLSKPEIQIIQNELGNPYDVLYCMRIPVFGKFKVGESLPNKFQAYMTNLSLDF